MGIYQYNETKDEFTYHRFPVGQPERPFLQSFIYDNKDNIWIATDFGLFQFDIKKQKIIAHTNQSENLKSISNNYVTDICLSSRGILWFGTANGLNKYDYQTNEFTSYFQEVNGDFSNVITSITEDSEEQLWVTHHMTNIGSTISRFNTNTKTFRKIEENLFFETTISASYTVVRNVVFNKNLPFKDRFGNIWFGSFGGGASKFAPINKNFETFLPDPLDPTSIPTGGLWNFAEDDNGLIWCSLINSGLIAVDKKTNKVVKTISPNPNNPNGLTASWIHSISKDRNGDLWLATQGDGLNKLDPVTNKITHIRSDPEDENSITNSRFISFGMVDSKNRLWLSIRGYGIDIYDIDNDKFTHIRTDMNDSSGLILPIISHILEDSNGNYWIAAGFGNLPVQRYNLETNTFYTIPTDRTDGTGLRQNNVITTIEDRNENIWFATTGTGICKYNPKTKKYKYYDEDDGLCNNFVYMIVEDDDGIFWISTNIGISRFDPETEIFKNYNVKDGLQSNEFNAGAAFKAEGGKIYLGGLYGFNAFYPQNIKIDSIAPKVLLKNFKINGKEVSVLPPSKNNILFKFDKNQIIISDKQYYLTTGIAYTDTIILSFRENRFSFEMVGFGNMYPSENGYKYKLENFDDDWQYSDTRRFVSYTNLPHGEYTFIAYAGNSDDVWSKKPVKIFIKISPPFWKTWWFRIGSIILILSLTYVAYRLKIRQIRLEKEHLEDKVLVRTQEITEKNEELKQQQQEILTQTESLENANEIITKKNKDIVDSINYASRIQHALLPSKKLLSKNLLSYFILYKPKDIVSGDFYYFKKINQYIIVAAADCTGHGVPGGFVSMLGISFLNEIVVKKEVVSAAQILEELRIQVKTSLNQEGAEVTNSDGMDIALCVVDTETNELQFSGANNPLIIIRNNELINIKGTRNPIGIYIKEKDFKNEKIQLQKDDIIYLFSDGYADQFGGDRYKKFSIRRLKDLLLSIHKKTIDDQKIALNETIENWKGEEEQIDDILIMGIRMEEN